MTQPAPSDALVFFGATGDLAYKQIFPALQALVARHGFASPIVGVARSGGGAESPGTFGPPEADRIFAPGDGWIDPQAAAISP
jgi:hypothetical protein